MNLDARLDSAQARQASEVLIAGGFPDASVELCESSSLRAIVWWLGGASLRRRKIVLELLDVVVDAA